MSDDDTTATVQFLRDHPRMIGVLFTLAVLLTQTTPVMAGGGCGTCSG